MLGFTKTTSGSIEINSRIYKSGGYMGEEFQKVFSFHLFVHATQFRDLLLIRSFVRLFACEKKNKKKDGFYIIFFKYFPS